MQTNTADMGRTARILLAFLKYYTESSRLLTKSSELELLRSCTHVCARTHTHTHVRTHAHTHTHTHTHNIHTHTHTHTSTEKERHTALPAKGWQNVQRVNLSVRSVTKVTKRTGVSKRATTPGMLSTGCFSHMYHGQYIYKSMTCTAKSKAGLA